MYYNEIDNIPDAVKMNSVMSYTPNTSPILPNGQYKINKPTRKTRKSINNSKRKQIQQTLTWLDENYVVNEGICLPRCTLYSHYTDFCSKHSLEAACPATFGKMIRQKFPNISTRRLGTRGHSKYHYYGIGIRETSPYYQSVYNSKGLTRFSPNFYENNNNNVPNNESIQSDQQNPFQLPDLNKIIRIEFKNLTPENVHAILLQHQQYCHKVMELTRCKNLKQIGECILCFWPSFCCNYNAAFDNSLICDVIRINESVLQKCLIATFVPTSLDNIQINALDELRYLSQNYELWMGKSLKLIKGALQKTISISSQHFSNSLKRQASILQLSMQVTDIFNNCDKFTCMQRDICSIQLDSFEGHAFYASAESKGQDIELNAELFKRLKELLNQPARVESYVEWLDEIIELKVIKPSKVSGRSTKKRAQDFFLKWSFFGARIIHNLSLSSASVAANSFHLLRMLCDEYVLFAIETQCNMDKDNELEVIIEKHLKKREALEPSYITDHQKYPSTIVYQYNNNPQQIPDGRNWNNMFQQQSYDDLGDLRTIMYNSGNEDFQPKTYSELSDPRKIDTIYQYTQMNGGQQQPCYSNCSTQSSETSGRISGSFTTFDMQQWNAQQREMNEMSPIKLQQQITPQTFNQVSVISSTDKSQTISPKHNVNLSLSNESYDENSLLPSLKQSDSMQNFSEYDYDSESFTGSEENIVTDMNPASSVSIAEFIDLEKQKSPQMFYDTTSVINGDMF